MQPTIHPSYQRAHPPQIGDPGCDENLNPAVWDGSRWLSFRDNEGLLLLVDDLRRESALRHQHPSLAKAWADYQLLLKLYRTDID